VKRLLALVAALALVGGALRFDRSRRADGSTSNGRAAEAPATRLLCPTELRAVCEEAARATAGLVVGVEPTGRSVDRFAKADFQPPVADADAWLVPSSWVGVLGAARQRLNLGLDPQIGEHGEPMVTSPLVFVAWSDRWAELTQKCNAVPTWACLATLASANGQVGAVSWPGGLKVGFDSPAEGLAGPAEVGLMARSLLGRGDVATNDVTEPALTGGLDGLFRARTEPGSALNEPVSLMLSVGRSRFDVVGTADALARARIGGRQDVVIAADTPPARLDLVLVRLAGHPEVAAARRQAIVDALLAGGWKSPEAGADGLPDGGTLEALRSGR
jgi:hypothetical protein